MVVVQVKGVRAIMMDHVLHGHEEKRSGPRSQNWFWREGPCRQMWKFVWGVTADGKRGPLPTSPPHT